MIKLKKAKLIKSNKSEQKEMEKSSYSLKNLLSIILILVIVLAIFYIITSLVVDPVEQNNTDSTATEIDSVKITLNNLLDRKEQEYYVLVTKENKNTKVNYLELYNNYINKYSSLENALTFYNIDLDDALNKNYISDETNISNDLNKLKLNDEVLFKIKNGKIEEYFVGSSDILKTLSNLKES